MRQKLEEVDKTGHSTERATKEILQLISAEYGEDIILNEDFMTTDRMYAGVQSIYKYGCQTCTALGQFPRPLEACPTCLDAKATYDGGKKSENSPPPPRLFQMKLILIQLHRKMWKIMANGHFPQPVPTQTRNYTWQREITI